MKNINCGQKSRKNSRKKYLFRLDGRVHCFPVPLLGLIEISFSGEAEKKLSEIGEFFIGRNMFDGEDSSTEGEGGVEDMFSFSVDELKFIELLT